MNKKSSGRKAKGEVANRIRMTALLLLALFILPVGYADEHIYQPETIFYSEKEAQYSFRREMELTATSLAKYYFDPAIEKAERSLCIEATDRILANQAIKEAVPEIYVFTPDTYDGLYLEENRLYQSVRAWETPDYVTDVLLAVYGKFSHYGLAYGYAHWLCGEYAWSSMPEHSFIVPGVSSVCDLNLLCLNAAFVGEQDAAVAQALAYNFVQSFIAENGEAALQKLLSASDTAEGMEAVGNELALYYQSHGLDYIPSLLRFGSGGTAFDYLVSCDTGTFYISKDWSDRNLQANPMLYQGFLHKNYPDIQQFFEINLKQMEQYQALFALDDYRNGLSILFVNSGGSSNYSFYQSGTHRIYVKNIDSFMHEYIHALTQPQTSMEMWKTEGFARYFSYRYDYYGIAFLNQDYNSAPDSAATRYVHEYRNKINRPIDMAADYGEIENIAVWSRSYTNPNASYVAGSSFVQYLVGQYGERAVVDSLYGDGTPLPKSYTELVHDWNAYIQDTYQDYSKYP